MKLLLVEDHPIVIDALTVILTKVYPEVVVTAAKNSSDAPDLLRDQVWDATIMDLSLGAKLMGFELIASARSIHAKLPIVVLSMHMEGEIISRALAAGANAYVVKSDPPAQIFNALEAARAGQEYLSESAAAPLVFRPCSQTLSLSEREREVARMVADGNRSKDIAKTLAISPRTVEVHRKNILKKLGAKNTAQLVGILGKNF